MLKQYRESRNWNLTEAAKAFGLSKSYLSELENGRSVSLKAARQIEQKTRGELKAAELLNLTGPEVEGEPTAA